MDHPPIHTIKGYQLLDLLGEGAYGAVYRAHQEAVDREVAVKIILPEFANQPGFIRRFETEAQLVAQLEHLHIVPLYDFWRDPEGAYLVMRLMKGGSLEESLAADGPWTPEQAARLLDQVASALESAHQQGVVHRDLKPANILLDEAGNAYLSDFGIAKELGVRSSTQDSEAILGTPAYLTPEQVQSQSVTPQTDIYALGVLLFELLTGEHPFPGSSTSDLVARHLNEPLPMVHEINPELPPALDIVIQKATAKDPADRYPSALALAGDFRRSLELDIYGTEVPEAELYNPYKGLRAFQESDRDDFFGREVLTGQLLAHLASPGPGSRFLAVVGPSGCGKSSVVKAGLLPALRKGALPGSDQWFIVEMHPGSQPFKELELALLGISSDFDLDLGEILSQEEHAIQNAVQAVLPSGESQLLLLIDQFEELFVLVQDEDLRSRFLADLQSAVTDPNTSLRVVVTLRADFYDRPLMYPHFGRLVEEHTTVVLPLSSEELEQAIQQPAGRVGVGFEDGLVATITSDVADQPGMLPLLQYALTGLFERRDGRTLTRQAYLDIGGVVGALGRTAELIYSNLEPDQQVITRQVFLRLVTLGEGAEDTRRRVLVSELEALAPSPSPNHGRGGQGVREDKGVRAVLDAFGSARLLSFDHDPTTRGSTVEVAHEALLREWSRLREWLDESRADIRMQLVLTNATRDWLTGDKEPSFLLRGTRLAQFEDWAGTTSLALTPDEKLYLQASLEDEALRKEKQAALERRSRNFLRALVGVFAVAAIIAVGLSIFAFNQQGIAESEANSRATQQAIAEDEAIQRATQQAIAENEAESRATQQAIAENEAIARGEAEQQAIEERDKALKAELEARTQAAIGLAGQAMNEMNGHQPERAVPLALEAVENYPYTWQARRALGMAVLNHKLDQVYEHGGRINQTYLSNDGKRLLSSSRDEHKVRIWDTASGKILVTIDELYSPLATGSPDKYRMLLVSEKELQGDWFQVTKLFSPIATWSPDESLMLIMSEDEQQGFWFQIVDGYTGKYLVSNHFESEFFRGYVYQPWSPDGERFVTAHGDGSARIWDASTGEEVHRLSGHEGLVTAYWSPAENIILVNGHRDGTLTLWDADQGEQIYSMEVPVGGSSFRGWSPSGDRFIIRDFGEVRIYETSTGDELLTLEIPDVTTDYAAFSPDGKLLITSGFEDGTARMWDAETGRQVSSISGMTQAQDIAWSPTGKMAAVGGTDGLIRVWDVASGSVKSEVTFPIDIGYLDWSPEEDRLYLASFGVSDVMVFRLDHTLFELPGVVGGAGSTTWSPDGRYMAASFLDGSLPVWDADTGEELFNFYSGDWFGGLDWSPSMDQILTYNVEGPLKLWDSSTGELLLESPVTEGASFTAEWSPDGNQIVSTSWNEATRVFIWDAASLEVIRYFDLEGGALTASWSPDGKRIAVTSDSGEASIRDAATGEVLLHLLPEDYKEQVDGIAWTSDGEQVILFSMGTGYLFDTATGEELMQYIGHTSAVFVINWSPDEKYIYTAGGDGTVRVFEVDTGVELLVYDIGGWTEASVSPDGSRIMISSGDGTVYVYPIWDTIEKLVEYARECCLIHQLTPEEREQFGLPPK